MTDDDAADAKDWQLLHYAIGLIIGLADKHGGLIDVTIYHDSFHIRIERVKDHVLAS